MSITKIIMGFLIVLCAFSVVGCSDDDDDEKKPAVVADKDKDGIEDSKDNCPDDANKDQADDDGDGEGDVCDATPNRQFTGLVRSVGGSIALFEQPSTLRAFTDFLLSPAAAGLSGLQPLTSGTVELVRINDAGEQVGPVLATGSIGSDGTYIVLVPLGLLITSDLILRVTGSDGTTTMSSIATSTNIPVNIDPITEFILRKFLEADTELADLLASVVIALVLEIEKFDILAGGDLEETIEELDDQAGEFTENKVAEANSGQGDASSLAGDWVNFRFAISLHDTDTTGGNERRSGVYSIEQGRSDLAVSDAGSGTISVTTGAETEAHSFLNTELIDEGTRHQFFLTHETFASTGGDTFNATVNDKGDVTITSGLEDAVDIEDNDNEDDGPEFGVRHFPVTTLRSNDETSNLLVGSSRSTGIRYETIDTNDDGVKDALDDNKKNGDEVALDFEVAIKKGSGLNASVLNGNYGLVDFSVDFTVLDFINADAEFNSEIGVVNFDGVGTYGAAIGALEETGFNRASSEAAFPNVGLSSGSETNGSAKEAAYSVSPNGLLNIDDDERGEGQVSADGKFFMLSGDSVQDTNLDPDSVTSTDHHIVMGVKLGSTLPALGDAVYRVVPLITDFRPNGFHDVLTFGSDATLTFSDDAGSAVIAGNDFGVARDNDLAQNEFPTNPIGWGPFNTNIQANGAIEMTATDATGLELKGFVSADGQIILLQMFASVGGDADVLLSPAILIRQPANDPDGDGIDSAIDNCPDTANADQANLDGDAQGDVCDADIDGDGVENNVDVFPQDATESADADTDGVGDNADNCPNDANADQANADGDDEGDVCDDTPNGGGLIDAIWDVFNWDNANWQ